MGVGQFLKKLIHKDAESLCGNQSYAFIEPTEFSLQDANNLYYDYLFEGRAETRLTVPQKLVIELTANHLKKKEHRAHAVPRLPSIIPKLLRSLRDPNSSAKDYVEIINKDPAMSAAVLKLANSAYFNPIGSNIDEIDRAVVKLGIDGLRSVLSAAVMQPIIQRDSPYFNQTGQRLWMHSLNCAVACEVIGSVRKMDRYKVYLLGLVHDIGKIALFCELCKQFKLNGEKEPPTTHAFMPLMKKLSAQLSYWIACDWELPIDICEALRQQIGLNVETELSCYGHLLYQANLATELYAVTPKNKRSQLDTVLHSLRLPADLWDKLDSVSTQL